MGNLIWDVDSVTVSNLIYNDSPLQNATDIVSKCDSILLQNELVFTLQNVTVLLQNATVITNCGNFITKCDSYYKMWRLVQIATVYTWSIVLGFISTFNRGALLISFSYDCL